MFFKRTKDGSSERALWLDNNNNNNNNNDVLVKLPNQYGKNLGYISSLSLIYLANNLLCVAVRRTILLPLL